MESISPDKDWEAYARLRQDNRERMAKSAFNAFLMNEIAAEYQNFYKLEMIPGGFGFYYLRGDPIAGQQKVFVRQYWFTTESAEDCKYEKI